MVVFPMPSVDEHPDVAQVRVMFPTDIPDARMRSQQMEGSFDRIADAVRRFWCFLFESEPVPNTIQVGFDLHMQV